MVIYLLYHGKHARDDPDDEGQIHGARIQQNTGWRHEYSRPNNTANNHGDTVQKTHLRLKADLIVARFNDVLSSPIFLRYLRIFLSVTFRGRHLAGEVFQNNSIQLEKWSIIRCFTRTQKQLFVVDTKRVTPQTKRQTTRPQSWLHWKNVGKKLHEHKILPLMIPAIQLHHPLRFRAFNGLVRSLSRRCQCAHSSTSTPIISWPSHEKKYITAVAVMTWNKQIAICCKTTIKNEFI